MHNDPSVTSRRLGLGRLLGGFAPRPFSILRRVSITSGSAECRVEELSLLEESGEPVRAVLTGPAGSWRNQPAVLYCHAHGNRYGIGARELIDGRPSLQPEPYGPALARRGVVALSIDMPCFGLRATQEESALAKRCLWEGRTLFGQMLEELAGGFALLREMEGVDPARIAVFGLSMGATQAFWLGALEPRIARVAHACCCADLATLVSRGAHDLHGAYMTVPGLLPFIRTGEIAGLAAPRPHLAMMGALDPLTPPEALAIALDDLRHAYRKAPEALRILVESEAGHQETPAMRAATLAFLA